jgi:hypothetical protein
VTVGAKASAWRDPVFVDDAQVAKAHVGRVNVIGKRKAVKRLEPAMVGVAPLGGFAQGQHGVLLEDMGSTLRTPQAMKVQSVYRHHSNYLK